MADNPDIQAILAALASSSHPNAQGPAGHSMPSYPTAPPPAHYSSISPAPQTHYGLPQPAAEGNVDLSHIRPVGSGTVSIAESIAQARAFAAEKGATPYDRPIVYAQGGRPGEAHNYPRRSRSRSPPVHRDAGYREGSRDGPNPYRDERRDRRDDRGGRRDYRDRSYSPQSRERDGGRGGPSRGRAGGGDENSEVISIESSLVGLIIGRQGENLRRIESETSCRVQFLPPNPEGGTFRQCKITGPPARRAEVKAAVDKIIDDNGMGALNRQPDRNGNRAGPELREGEDHVKMSVPDRTVGLIIGRGGETIRDLQEKSGCHINIVDEKQSVNGLRPVNLIGTPEAAQMARMLILQIVETDNQSLEPGRSVPKNTSVGGDFARGPPVASGNGGNSMAGGMGSTGGMGGSGGGGGGGGGGGSDRITEKMFVPSDTVGMIIGKGGETIRDIQQQSGCKVNVIQPVPGQPPEPQREIHLIGSRDSIERARAAILDKTELARQRGPGGAGGGPRARPNNQHSQGRSEYHDAYAPHAANTNPPSQAAAPPAAANGADPYAPWGGYDKYVAACWAYLAQQGGTGMPGAAGVPAAPPGQ